MDEKEIEALKQKASQLEVDLKDAKEKEAKALSDKESTVSELTKLRTAKQEVEAELTLAKSKLTPDNSSQGTVEEQVKKVLDGKEQEKLAELRVSTEQKFKASHTEFHPDNDAGGLKYAAFQEKLKRINLDGLKTEEEIMSAFDDALVIMNKGKSENNSQFNPYAATNKNSSGDPKGDINNKLANTESKLIAQLGWTEERYLKVKKSQPHYVESMLSHVK